jgi:hypothetical protein
MPLYFFHLDGDDDGGTELPAEGSARMQAHRTFGMMIRDGDVSDAAEMNVVSGRSVIVLRFSAEQ